MMSSRRDFLQAVVAGSAALGVGWSHGESLAAVEREALRTARQQAAHRRRRIIYNNDGDDIFAAGATTKEKFYELRHRPLLETQVDTIYYCTTQSFNNYTHATQVAEQFVKSGSPLPANNLPLFLQHQTDGLRMSCEFSNQHGFESIWTMRMNDIHDVQIPIYFPQWKKSDSTRVMGTLDDVKRFTDRRRLWTLVNFEHPDVEPRILAIIEEVLRNYSLDGIDLDFLRAPFYFRTTYEGLPATDSQTATLTQLVEKVRNLVLAESERQGKPLLLSCRGPVTETLCQYLGINVRHWLKAGLIDTLSLGGGYVAFDQPVAELIALGHEHRVPVYPCLSRSGLWYRPPRGVGEVTQPTAVWNGAAARLWQAGADGIQVFNVFPHNNVGERFARTLFTTIGDPKTILSSERAFQVSDAGNYMPSHYWAKDVEEFSGALPVALKRTGSTVVTLVAAGPLASAGTPFESELRLDFAGLGNATSPAVRFNGHDLGKPLRSEGVAQVQRQSYAVPSNVPNAGPNQIEIDATSAEAQLAGAELWITPQS